MNKKEVKQKIETELKLRGCSKITIKNYCYHNLKFLESIKKPVESITEDDIKTYLVSFLDQGKTINQQISALRFFYDSILKRNLLSDIKKPKRHRKIPILLTKEEVKRLINVANNLSERILIEVLYSTGLRIHECISLKVTDLNLEDKTGIVRNGKGGKDRFFILSERLIHDLMLYLRNHNHHKKIFPGTHILNYEYLFPTPRGDHLDVRSAQTILKRLGEKAMIKKRVYPHLLRSCFASHLYESGVDIRKLQILLGHADINTTQLYTQVSPESLKKIQSPLDTLGL